MRSMAQKIQIAGSEAMGERHAAARGSRAKGEDGLRTQAAGTEAMGGRW